MNLQEATQKVLLGKLIESNVNIKNNSEIKKLLDSGRAKFSKLDKILTKLYDNQSIDKDLYWTADSLIEAARTQLNDFIFENDLDYNDNNMFMEENHLVNVIIDRLQEYLDEDEEYVDTDFSEEMHN